MSRDVPTFRVASNSRHPILGRDYDAKTHRYTTAYLNPGKYVLLPASFACLLFHRTSHLLGARIFPRL